MAQAELFQPVEPDTFIPDLKSYDKIIVAFSGGKDSTAAFLYLLELGVKSERIELWHHDIDGRESDKSFMDWPVTPAYCQAFADAFNVPVFNSWKEGGFRREMLRRNDYTAPTVFEEPDGTLGRTKVIKNPKFLNTRRKFPQVSADLSVRWCSAYLKIDVCAAAIRNQKRFRNCKTLVITGERGQESTARSKYEQFEPHKADLRNGKRFQRHVDHWRPVLHWYETDVWSIIEKYKVRVHPAYYLGWGRVSCCTCIFGSNDQWASAAKVVPDQVKEVSRYEQEFGVTIKQGKTVNEMIASGKEYDNISPNLIKIATSKTYHLSIFMDRWQLPSGAYGDTSGPV